MNAITRKEQTQLQSAPVHFELNGRPVQGQAHQTILDVAKANGVKIPHLCYKDGLDRAGNCRACVVEVSGERTLAASCCRMPTEGMKVSTQRSEEHV